LAKAGEQVELTKLRLDSLHSDMDSKKKLQAKKFASAAEIRRLQRDLDNEKINLVRLVAAQQELDVQVEQLLKQGTIAISQFVNSRESELQAKEVNVAEDEIDLSRFQNELSKRIIYSPVEGTVIDTSSSVITNYAQQSELLLKIAPKSKLSILKARVDIADIDNFRHGGMAKVRFFSYADLQDYLYEAKIVTINPIVSQRNVSNWTEAFYEVTLKMADERYESFSDKIINGTPVEVLFKAEETTLAKAIMRPITKNWPKIFEQ
jgi:HlyD family secretion protein